MEFFISRRQFGAIATVFGALLASTALAASGKPPPDYTIVPFGRTPGAPSVTTDGEAAYSIPLKLPPGTNGMTPELSLEYRHRTTGGLLGIGWSIGGLSQIAPCPRTIAQDGIAAPVSVSPADRFCFDGQRLVAVNGVAYGAPGAEYRTEIESFARIRSFTGPGLGPQYFVVESADGRILEYGATADSRWDGGINPPHYARVWALNRIRDRSGNVIDYQYVEDVANGSFRIASIRYNSNPGAGVAASHQINFNYENRPNSEVDVAYVAGSPIRNVVRLTRIDILHGASVVRRYELRYEPALTVAGRSRLESVQECGADLVNCLAPTQFTWSNGSSELGAQSSVAVVPPPGPVLSESLIATVADINGDGRSDLVWASGASRSSATVRIRLGQTNGAFGNETDTGIASPSGVGVPFDHNGDGRIDFLTFDATGRWLVLPGSAAGFGAPLATGIPAPYQLHDFRGADMNGDGLGDIAYSQHYANTGNSLAVSVRYALPGGGFSDTPVMLYEQWPALHHEYAEGGDFIGEPGERIDLDGDGAEDLLMNENYTIARISASRYVTEYFDEAFISPLPIDLNGDGCTDLVYRHSTSKRLRARVGGCGIEWAGPDLLGPPWTGSPQFVATDWNGDGRDDVLLRGTTNWQVALYLGDSFAPIADTGVPHDGHAPARARDTNGDGLDDLLQRVNNQLRIRLRSGGKGDLIQSATDGFGVTAAYTYRPLTDDNVYTRGSGAAYPEQDMQSAAHVVSELATTDGSGTGALAATQYRYEGLRQHLHGRGTLGFSKRIVTDPAPGQAIQVEESRHRTYPLTGLPKSVIARRTGVLLSETTIDWTSMTLGTGTARRQFPHVASVTSRRHELGGVHAGAGITATTRVVAAIDATSGLVTDETTTVTELASGASPASSASQRVLHTAFLNDTNNWCLGRPQSTQVTASHTLAGGNGITQSSSQVWDGLKCRPTQQLAEPGSSQWQVRRALSYDSFGNLAGTTVTGAGMGARTTSTTWDPRGQFPVDVRDALTYSTTIAWNPATGLPLAVTDPNFLTVAWNYDNFGRPVGETRPDGTRTRLSLEDCSGGCDPRARARIVLEELDSAGIVQATSVIDIDQLGRQIRSTSQQAGGGYSVTTSETDARGRLSREYLPYWLGGTPPGYIQYEYDAIDRPVRLSLRSAEGATERSLELHHDGLKLTQVDSLGRATSMVATAWGDVDNVTDAAGGVTRYRYDAFGRPLEVRDATGKAVASFLYNTRGMLLSQTDADLGTWTITPNALGEVVAVRDAKGQTVTYGYDPVGRLVSRAAPDGASIWTWGRSASARNIGRLERLSAPSYREFYAYDAFGRPKTHTISTDSTYHYDYAYNSLGLLDSLTYPATLSGARFKIGHEYDAGRLVRIRDANAPATVFWQLNAQDAAGNPIDESLGSGTRVVAGVNPVTGLLEYRQAGVGGGSGIQNLAWGWDPVGNLLRRQDLNRGVSEEFRYDALDRLDDSRRNGAINLDLAYDAIGNITWKSDVCPSSTPCFSYDATRRHAVTAAGGVSYGYDANGNMTNRGGAAIVWNSANLPTSIPRPGGGNSQFWYGPAGNRWKQVSSQGGASETTIYAGGLMEKVTQGTSTSWRHYVVAPTGTAAVHLRYTGGSPAKTRLLTHDHLGSTGQLLDTSGGVLASESFDAFGRRRGANWTGLPTTQEMAVIGSVTRDGFTGHEHLDNLGLIHMEGRVYDPQIGRFLSADPFVSAPFDGQSLNRYSYVWNNPLSFVDPSGFECVRPVNSERCARVTVIGKRVYQHIYVGGAGWGQVMSAKERDPCGQESDGYTCATHSGNIFASVRFTLTAGTQTDATLTRSPTTDFLQGTAARLGNLLIDAAPVTWLFGAPSGFEWFAIPGSEAGRAGSFVGNVGMVVGGFGGVIRSGVAGLKGSASAFARSLQGPGTKFPGIDPFRDILLKRGKLIFGAYPGQGYFYTTASAIRRSGGSMEFFYNGLQMLKSDRHPLRTSMAVYEVLDDIPAAFGLALRNTDNGTGWLPQIVVPAYESSLRFLGLIPMRP